MKFFDDNKCLRKSKFLALKFLNVKERVKGKEVSITHIGNNSMITEPLTKELSTKRFIEHVARIGVVSAKEDVQF